MKFTKMHGIGNDYIYFNCLSQMPKNLSETAIRLSDRHFGIGGDGIVLILPSNKADFMMRMFNADGSEGKMCGNAIRCVGKYVYEKGLTSKTSLSIETLSGIKYLTLKIDYNTVSAVTVDMGEPILESRKIPVRFGKGKVINEKVQIAGGEHSITCVSMGNPHCIVFCDDVKGLDLEKIGPDWENDKMFPDRVNTEFVKVVDDKTLEMRVWERGSGETLACGTGACATAVAAVLCGICQKGQEITVRLRGGNLVVIYSENETVYMTGPASFVFEGEVADLKTEALNV
ncbi:MAG: diaminopimelate epimerase [Bacillota bacterium]|nr:diaminopimelate epimerase [Bacillota bacterium]